MQRKNKKKKKKKQKRTKVNKREREFRLRPSLRQDSITLSNGKVSEYEM